jgi:hypothetical protein
MPKPPNVDIIRKPIEEQLLQALETKQYLELTLKILKYTYCRMI